ncbi:MAG: hypothetical protein PHQ65_13055 [Bacteroidales bacterium]|nr:hypothetical protein [Bacteroidales bacterium]MDD3666187.1 hypothetical protein [Bacteroidales bacterium]
MKRKIFYFLVTSVLGWSGCLGNQTDTSRFTPEGQMVVQVINRTDYDFRLQQGGMTINRAHFGYQYQFAPQWLGKVVVDAGRPTVFGSLNVADTAGNPLPTSYNYKEGSYFTMTLKFSYLQWKPNEHLTLQAGGILQNHYITQEKFWGYRYIFETFQDRYFGTPSGDLGAIVYYTPWPWLSADLAITNGEGFRVNQDANGRAKWAVGIDLKPAQWLQFRFYADQKYFSNPTDAGMSQTIWSVFSGVRFTKKWRSAFEITRLNHYNGLSGRDLFGVSAFAAWSPVEKFECFLRYDALGSSGLDGRAGGWNRDNDGQLWMGGVQYLVAPGVSTALSYRYHTADPDATTPDYSVVSFSFEYKLN